MPPALNVPHGELISKLAWSHQDLGREEGLSPSGKTRHDVRAYLTTYLKEFYMKLRIRQQAGLRSFEHSSGLGGPSPWGGGRENRFPMAKWLRLGRRASTNPIPAAPSDPKTRQHPRGGRPQKFSWEGGSARDAASGGSFYDLAFEEGGNAR